MIKADLSIDRWFADGAGELHAQFELATGSLTVLVGPSGSGKTTILRLLAGLGKPTHGQIIVNNHTWLDTQQRINLRPQQRSVGYIFQDAALFPNLTVRENILFVTPKGEQALANQLIETTGLTPFVDKKPVALSGGQQQRVALARALVRRPECLLLDEPFAALDGAAAEQLRRVLLDMHRAWGTTTLLVSHHEADVQALADRVIRLGQGKIQEDYQVSKANTHTPESIRRVWYDDIQQQWVIETDTVQLRSADPRWAKAQVGAVLEFGWQRAFRD